MFRVERREDVLVRYVLSDSNASSSLEIVPSRGGIVSGFHVGEFPILAMDESTLLDTAKNVRGGIPVLFPAPGRLADDRYLHSGKAYAMKQHGFARGLPWEVVPGSEQTDGDARLTLGLSSSESTRAFFPFDFRLDFTFLLAGSVLPIRQRYENRSPEPMPLHAGFHPYFFVPDAEKRETTIETGATRAFDNVTKRDVAFEGFDLTQAEVDLHLHDHGSTRCALRRPDGTRIEVRGSREFTHWVVWTLAGRDFVCLEPWTAPGNALNSGERLLWLAPGEARELALEIEVQI